MRNVELADEIKVMWTIDRLHSRSKPHRPLRVEIRFNVAERRIWIIESSCDRLIAINGLLMLSRGKLKILTYFK
jgi:hypothetical protein